MQTRTLRNIVLALSLFLVSAVSFAQRHGGGHGGWVNNNDYEVESKARSVAQDARSLKQQLELMDGRRGGGRDGRHTRGRHGRGLFPIINALQTVAMDARSVARAARNGQDTNFPFRKLERSFQSYQSIGIAIQRNPRLSYEVNALNRSMDELRREMRQGGGSQTLQQAKRQSRRLARITSELASQVRADLTYRRYQTHSEREALRATSELSSEAQRFSDMVQRSRPALYRAKNQFPSLRMKFRQAKRALRNVVSSYTVTEKLDRAQEVIRRLAETLDASVRGGGHGGGRHGGNDFDFYGIQ